MAAKLTHFGPWLSGELPDPTGLAEYVGEETRTAREQPSPPERWGANS